MSTWNHRIVKETLTGTAFDEVRYGIHEVYYNDAGEICGYTEKPVEIACFIDCFSDGRSDPVGELRDTVDRLFRCLETSVIDGDTLVFAPWGDEESEDIR